MTILKLDEQDTLYQVDASGFEGETITFDLNDIRTLKNENIEILIEVDCNIIVNYVWDSHGKCIPFPYNGRTTMKQNNVHAKITKIERTYAYDDGDVSDEESWDLELNGEKHPGDVYRYSYNEKNNTLRVKLCVGAG